MGHLILVRHAQASFLAPDYDQLSSLGELQARRLGEYWSQRNFLFDRVYSGPRVRQLDTAKIVAESYERAQLRFPPPVLMKEFDEFDAETVVKQGLPRLLESDAQVRALDEAYRRSKQDGEQQRSFQRILEVVVGKWVGGALVISGVESWSEFCARVHRGLSQVVCEARASERIVIFSSGGPIAVAIERALNLSPNDTLRTVWMSRNCSYSEFLFSGDRFTLSSFNAFPHLDNADWLTYR